MTKPKVPRRSPRGLLTSQEFAHRVDGSVNELARLHAEGIFEAHIPGGIGRGNQRMYSEDQVAVYMHALNGGALPPPEKVKEKHDDHARKSITAKLHAVPFTGEQAKTGFAALEGGASVLDLVIYNGLHPDVAGAVAVSWSNMSGSILITKETLDRAAGLSLSGPFPIRNEDDFLEVLRIAAEENMCGSCKKSAKHFCRRCVMLAVVEARQEERERLQPTPEETAAE